MAQGKLKVKTKVPENVKHKNKGIKGSAVTKRASKYSRVSSFFYVGIYLLKLF